MHCDERRLEEDEAGRREEGIDTPLQDSQAICPKLYPIAWPWQTTHVRSAFLFFVVVVVFAASPAALKIREELLDIRWIEAGEELLLFVSDRAENDDLRLGKFASSHCPFPLLQMQTNLRKSTRCARQQQVKGKPSSVNNVGDIFLLLLLINSDSKDAAELIDPDVAREKHVEISKPNELRTMFEHRPMRRETFRRG